MEQASLRVLLIDDDRASYLTTKNLLMTSEEGTFSLDWVTDSAAALNAMTRREYDVYLLDYRLGPDSGLDVLQAARAQGCQEPIIFLTGQGDRRVDLAAMHAGATDYLVKGQLTAALLGRSLRYACERHRVEQQLAAQRADFLAMLTHDIRNPLGAILGYADLVRESFPEQGALEAQEFLEKLTGDVLTIQALVTNYLENARVGAGQLLTAREPLAINDLLRRIIGHYESLARVRRLTLEVQLQNDLPLIPGDALALERVVANLMHNALKFTPTDGRITLCSTSTPTHIIITVADTGPGIAPAEMPLLFEKYRRADKDRQYEGTGLGLFIVKTLIEAHAGRIEVVSTPGQGTCFTVFLPLTT